MASWSAVYGSGVAYRIYLAGIIMRMNTPIYTPSPSIDHEYGQPAHITGHRLIIDLAGPVSLELSDFEALEDEFKETLSKLNCIIERFKLTEQFQERTK